MLCSIFYYEEDKYFFRKLEIINFLINHFHISWEEDRSIIKTMFAYHFVNNNKILMIVILAFWIRERESERKTSS